ncbi:MAG: aspartate aminotransferase family protein [Holophaga sp.]|nr:aspartate aminotransferase family protein [Holophaga sp.]
MVASLLQGYEDFRAFVNPLVAARAELSEEPYRMVGVRDGHLIDADGREYLDFIAGWGTQAFGHRPPRIEAAIRTFLDGDAPSFFTSNLSPFAGTLARVLSERTGYDAAFFTNGGTEAVEAALKLARAATGRTGIACLAGAYHGCTFGSVAMMHPGVFRNGFGPHLPGVEALPFGEIEPLLKALADPNLAAIVMEPIQVESGVRPLPPEFLECLCRETAVRGVLLVADEIQTGLGRTGSLLASEDWPRRPDIVTLGKSFGGGLIPHSAMLTRRPIFDHAYGTLDKAEAHASTFSGNALACVASLAALECLDDNLLEEICIKGEAFREALEHWVAPSPLVKAIRGEGLLWGIELTQPDHPYFQFDYLGLPELSGYPAVGMLAVHRLYRAGFLTHVCGHAWQVIRVQPPFTTTQQELIAFARALREALDYLWSLQ